jgi:hypothetical protein
VEQPLIQIGLIDAKEETSRVANKLEAVRNTLYKCFPDQEHANVDELFAKDKSINFAVDYLQAGELPERTTLVSLVISSGHSVFGFLWLTNRRLFFAAAQSGLFMKPKPVYREYLYHDIHSVQFEKSRSFHSAKITLHMDETEQNKPIVVFESIVDNDRLQAIIDYLQYKLANPHALAAPVEEATDGDFIDGLERLRQLRDQGTITDAEFEAGKKKLLDL